VKGEISRFRDFKNLKVTILIILHKRRSTWKAQEVFPGDPNYMIMTAKQLIIDQGILSTPNPI
jgi:hypothetical protein